MYAPEKAAAAETAGDLESLKALVAACCRLLHMEGMLNYSGHVSARVPGRDALLIHSFLESRAHVTADDVLVCDLEGRVLPDSRPGKPPLETPIHAGIYQGRPDVNAVVHTHSELAAAFTMADAQILPMRSQAKRWASGVPVHPDPSLIRTMLQGHEVAQTLAHHNAALLRAHGGVVVAESLPAVLVDCVHFEENARAQVQARAIGPLKPLTEAELELLNNRNNRDEHVAKLWHYYLQRGRASGVLDGLQVHEGEA